MVPRHASGGANPDAADRADDDLQFVSLQYKPISASNVGKALTRFELGPRTGVWAEPSVIDTAAAELADTERMVTASEELFGPYRWGRYDMLVLPPSFPFGGMENPTLTFLTPSFIAGDKSLVSLIAHELAHSWSGNLTTNATWADFWLNEGTTVWAEQDNSP